MNMGDLIKENLKISGKRLEVMSKSQLGVALYDSVMKEQSQTIIETAEETLRRKQKSPIKMIRGEDKEEQEDRPTFCWGALRESVSPELRKHCVVEAS